MLARARSPRSFLLSLVITSPHNSQHIYSRMYIVKPVLKGLTGCCPSEKRPPGPSNAGARLSNGPKWPAGNRKHAGAPQSIVDWDRTLSDSEPADGRSALLLLY